MLIFVFISVIVTLIGCHEAEVETKQNDLQIYCFSAGKADAFLLTTAKGTVLIDAGEKDFGDELVAYLESEGIDHIDYLIVTHFDKDHVGGAAKVISSVPIGKVLQSNCPQDNGPYQKYAIALGNAEIEQVTVSETYTFTLDGIAYIIDPPKKDSYNNSPSNNSSLIVSVTNGNNSFLFMGDAEHERIKEFLSDSPAHYDFLKVPYHGYWQKKLDDLIRTVRPAYAVITSSLAEPEGEQTMELLSSIGAETFLTRTAPVIVRSDGENISVRYEEQQ